MSEIIEKIKGHIEENTILLFMKGSPETPQCGFSARTVKAVMDCGERFAFVDVLSNQDFVDIQVEVQISYPHSYHGHLEEKQ
jgi:monothiol glutaredoxin